MAFSLFHKKPLAVLTDAEKEQIVQAIREAESRTSGEIRVYFENKCKHIEPTERAAEIFLQLKMQHTKDRNAVLLYVALQDRQLAIFGDKGIYKKAGKEYWEALVEKILSHFNKENFAAGISEYVTQIGEGLHRFFPYDRAGDQNELPDDIVFGN